MKPGGMKGCSRKGKLPHITDNQQRIVRTTMLWGVLQRIFYVHITSGQKGDDFQTHHGHGVVPRKTNYLISQLTNQKVMKTQTNLTNTSFGQRITGNQKMESYETWA